MDTNTQSSWIEAIATVFGAIFVAVGLVYTAKQIRESQKVNRAQFLLQLDQALQQYNDVHVKLRGGEWADGKSGPSTVEEMSSVERYMGLFERVNTLIDDGIIDARTVDKFYGYRIRNIVANDWVKTYKLKKEAASWQDFLTLTRRLGISID